jgi:hypothetical protein
MPNFTDLLSSDPVEESTETPEIEEVDPIDEDASVSSDGEGEESSDDSSDESADYSETRSDGGEASTEEGEDAEPKPIGDGRTIPAELKELIKAHPERAKLLKDLYFTNARYNKFGKVADLQKLKDLVDSYGSFEDAQRVKERLDEIGSLDELVQSHQAYERIDEQFTAGDPAYIDHIAKANPEAFAKLAPSFLQRFGDDHPEQYNYLMAGVVMSTLINNGTVNALSLLKQAAASGNIEQVRQIAAHLEQSISGIQELSARAPQVRAGNDPIAAQLETERQQIQRERQELFINSVKEQTAAWVSPEISKALKPFGKIKPELLNRLDRDTKEEIGTILGQNAQFQNKLKQAISRGDRDAAIRLYKQYVAPLIGNAARKIAGEYGLKAQAHKPGQPTQAQNGQRTQATSTKVEAGFEKVTKYPDVKDVRRDFPEYYDWAAKDMFLLKNGKKIKVVS